MEQKIRRIINFIVLALLLLMPAPGCSVFSSSDGDLPNIPGNMVLYVTTSSAERGILKIDPQNMSVTDTIPSGVTWSISLSPDCKILYTASQHSSSKINTAYAFDAVSKEVLNSQTIWNAHLQLDRTGKMLISMGVNNGIQILDAETFEILYQGHTNIRSALRQISVSPVKNKFYALIYEGVNEVEFKGVMVFNTDDFTLESIIPLTINHEQISAAAEGTFIDISPDGRYLYATTRFSFHVIDLEKKVQVFETETADYTWLAVSPDGRHVYLTDPYGVKFDNIYGATVGVPNVTDQILRYDTRNKKMEVFADGGSTFGFSTDALITTSIVVAPDSRSMFIRVLLFRESSDGKLPVPAILHVDTRSKEVINILEIELNLHQLKLCY